MLKKFLIVMGVLSTGFVASCALLLGFSAANDAPKNKALAETITRDLARGWNAHDLMPYLVGSVAQQLNVAQAQAAFDTLKPLGPLTRVDEVQQPRWPWSPPLRTAAPT
jgi:hypothetical protein